MTFLRYPHLCKFGNKEVESIEFGITHVFPKLDGTNASVWISFPQEGVEDDIKLQFGSRNRYISDTLATHDITSASDNQGFARSFYTDKQRHKNHYEYLIKNPTHILYGEWLVPHTIKTYRDEEAVKEIDLIRSGSFNWRHEIG